MNGLRVRVGVARQWGIWLAAVVIVGGGLSACGGQQASAPATTAPVATIAAQPTEAASPETIGQGTAAPGGTAQSGLAVGSATPSASASSATPVGAVPAAATPLAATPLAGATPLAATPGAATPVAGERAAARLAAECEAFAKWLDDPDVKAALSKTLLWPEIVAEGEKAAAGEPVDTAKMKQDFDQMEKVAQTLRTSDVPGIDHTTLQLAGRAMGLASRLAGGLANGNLDAKAAGKSVADLKDAIAAYEQDLASRQADCG